MLQILLIIFVLVPISIWLGTMIAQLGSMILIYLSVGLGAFAHKLFRGKSDDQWEAPDYIAIGQFIIIYGLILSVYTNVLGQYIHILHFLSVVGSTLQYIFFTLLLVDALILTVLATIHGKFEVLK